MGRPQAFIVEDDPLLGQIFSKTLESDFDVALITNGTEALSAWKPFQPRRRRCW